MKHVSLWLTVMLLGGLPLTAAAFNYGPNQQQLVADSGSTPQLPGAQVQAAAAGEMPKASAPDTMAADSDDSAQPELTAPQPRPLRTPEAAASHNHNHAISSNKPRQHPAHATNPDEPKPGPPSWQSLLPGSIQ